MTGNPRVFHLITRLLKGGAEAKTIQTVLGLEEYEFTVGYGAEYNPNQVLRLEDAGIETRRFASIRHYNPVAAVPAVAIVARYIQKNNFDIVHTHSTEAGIIGRFAASIAGSPIVIHTVHGVPFAPDRNDLLERLVLHCERAAAHRTDCFVTNADAIAEDYLSRGIGRSEQYTTIYSGIDVEQFQQAGPASDVTGEGVRVVMIGRLTNGKGFEDLLAAVDFLDRKNLSVYLVGDGPLRETLKAEIEERNLSNTIYMLGYRDDVPAILAACDVFVLPSYREGTPRVLTEAMASGLPVIATDIAGIPEQIEDGRNGFLIEPGNTATLVERLKKLLADPELRQEMGKQGMEQAHHFSAETMVEDLDEMYQELLKHRQGTEFNSEF